MTAYVRIEGAYDGTRAQSARVRNFASSLVNRYINGVSLEEKEGQTTLKVDELKSKELAVLKQLTWCYVIERPGLAVQQHAQRRLIDFLFDVFQNEVKRSPSHLFAYSGEGDQHSGVMSITIPADSDQAIGAKRRWQDDCVGSDRNRQEELIRSGDLGGGGKGRHLSPFSPRISV
jgi:dGTP triphosphohydrolase